MTWAKDLPVIVFAALGGAWIYTHGRRKLRDPLEILSRIKSGKIADLDEYITAEQDLLESDAKFWAISGGLKGLLDRRRKAVLLVQLCQGLCAQAGLPPAEMTYMSRRTFFISFFIAIGLIGYPIRWILKDVPHLTALAATRLYYDVESRAHMLCLEYREFSPELCDRILESI